MRQVIDKVAYWFADAFGTETTFGICAVLLVVWLVLIPFLGLGHWNATVGLGGNTIESTVELFLEIAILLKANQIARRQEEHRDLLDTHSRHLKRLSSRRPKEPPDA